jgi:hypothetical protein
MDRGPKNPTFQAPSNWWTSKVSLGSSLESKVEVESLELEAYRKASAARLSMKYDQSSFEMSLRLNSRGRWRYSG